MWVGGRHIEVSSVLQEMGFDWTEIGSREAMMQCPWPDQHTQGDRHPSFCINLETGAWLCYRGCDAGPLDKLVQRLNGVDERAAKRWLLRVAGGAGLSFKQVLASLPRPHDAQVDEASAVAQADYALMDPDTTSSYFLDRGFTWETIEQWGIRYDKGNRAVVVPIHARSGQIVGVARRLVPPFPAHMPKYMYTPGFKRSDHLFGVWQCQEGDGSTIVVEGLLDVIWLHQHGYQKVVALMGTYCSGPQMALLQRLSSRVLLALDNDKAGHKATAQLVKRMSSRMAVQAVSGYDGKDLQDLVEPELSRVLRDARLRVI